MHDIKEDFIKDAKVLNISCIQYRISNESYLVFQKDISNIALYRQKRGEENPALEMIQVYPYFSLIEGEFHSGVAYDIGSHFFMFGK